MIIRSNVHRILMMCAWDLERVLLLYSNRCPPLDVRGDSLARSLARPHGRPRKPSLLSFGASHSSSLCLSVSLTPARAHEDGLVGARASARARQQVRALSHSLLACLLRCAQAGVVRLCARLSGAVGASHPGRVCTRLCTLLSWSTVSVLECVCVCDWRQCARDNNLRQPVIECALSFLTVRKIANFVHCVHVRAHATGTTLRARRASLERK